LKEKDLTNLNILSETFLNDDFLIRWIGRCHYSTHLKRKFFYASASGFEVSFIGTTLRATFACSHTDDLSRQPYLSIFIDKDMNPLHNKTVVMDCQEKSVSLATHLEKGVHTVTILKRSEASDSDTSVVCIETDGEFIRPESEKDFFIEFVAASTSTGFANMANSPQEDKTTKNSNVFLAYSYLTGYLLDAEISIVAGSGWGISRGYNMEGVQSDFENIPNAYRYYGIDSSNRVITSLGFYDNSLKHPNVIVINLGTNDFFSSNYALLEKVEQVIVEERFRRDYLKFLANLRETHMNSIILVAYGLMNEIPLLGNIIEGIIKKANQEYGNIHGFIMVPAGYDGDPVGTYNHPTGKTHSRNAEALASLIHELTGRIIVHESIVWNE